MRIAHVSGGVISFKGASETDLLRRLRDGNAIETPLGLVKIMRVEREDGSGHSWNWWGELTPTCDRTCIPVSGYYRDAEFGHDGHGTIQIAA